MSSSMALETVWWFLAFQPILPIHSIHSYFFPLINHFRCYSVYILISSIYVLLTLPLSFFSEPLLKTTPDLFDSVGNCLVVLSFSTNSSNPLHQFLFLSFHQSFPMLLCLYSYFIYVLLTLPFSFSFLNLFGFPIHPFVYTIIVYLLHL